MSKLIIIMGATASGKDTVLNQMVKEGAKRFVSYTTRPMRIGEIYGKEYNFVTKEEFDNDIANGVVIEHREYTVANGDTWYYYYKKEDLDFTLEENHVCIADLNGAIELVNYYGGANTVVVFLNTPVHICLERALRRENPTTDKVKEICRRMISDINEIVNNPKAFRIADFVREINNSYDIYDLLFDLGIIKRRR